MISLRDQLTYAQRLLRAARPADKPILTAIVATLTKMLWLEEASNELKEQQHNENHT